MIVGQKKSQYGEEAGHIGTHPGEDTSNSGPLRVLTLNQITARKCLRILPEGLQVNIIESRV